MKSEGLIWNIPSLFSCRVSNLLKVGNPFPLNPLIYGNFFMRVYIIDRAVTPAKHGIYP
jgi:hypothetical protein